MPKFSDPTLAPLYDAAARFVDVALRGADSIFTPGRPVWSDANLDEFHRRFVLKPDQEGGSFEAKLRGQLDGAADDVIQLAAELIFVHLLPASGIGGEFKRSLVGTVLGWAAQPVAIPPECVAATEVGLAKGGTALNTFRYEFLCYLVNFVRHFRRLLPGEREAALSDPWRFKSVAYAVESHKAAGQREILLYLVHPESFEDMFSIKHKQRIAAAFQRYVEEPTDDLDERFLQIRNALEAQAGQRISFYAEPFKSQWQGGEMAAAAGDGASAPITRAAVRYWKVAPGSKAQYWDHCLRGGYISIGWNSLGDVRGLDHAAFKRRQVEVGERESEAGWGGSDQVWTFYNDLRPGDRVVANRGFFEVVGIGTVTGPYEFRKGEPQCHCVPVRWEDVRPRRVNQPGWRPTVRELDRPTFESILAAVNVPDAAAALADDTVASLLLARKNVVLYGPPGTGKTRASHVVADLWERAYGRGAVYQLTFHPSLAYEDFVEGFRPNADGKFERRDGLFVSACDAARRAHEEGSDRQFLLLIDELNRGDVARIFGELITLIEPDKRDPRYARRLPYSRAEFWVPPNLHVLGTMNSADRSVSLLDVAIRRRFCFVEYAPDPSAIELSAEHHKAVLGVRLSSLLAGLNARLRAAGVDRDRAVGHSQLLLPLGRDAAEALRERLRYDLLPLVEEYCYADRQRIGQIFGSLVDADGRLDDRLVDDDDALGEALTEIASGTAKGLD